jgi:hypothetical protein
VEIPGEVLAEAAAEIAAEILAELKARVEIRQPEELKVLVAVRYWDSLKS